MNEPAATTVLRADPQPLFGWVAVSLFGHGALLAAGLFVTLVGRSCLTSKPIVDPDDMMEVSMVVLPRSDARMPDRAARAPVPKGDPRPDAPRPTTPPVKQSDLAIHTDAPKPAPKGVSDVERRQQVMAELERQRLLDELLNAPEGVVDRDATDPNSTSDVAIHALGNASRGDPEFARYIAQVQQMFMKHFKPLPAITQANPGLATTLYIRVDASGRITAYEVRAASGVPAFDAAAERAVQEVGLIPPPPPKYLPLAAEGYSVQLVAP